MSFVHLSYGQVECMTETSISISPWGGDFVFTESDLSTHGFTSDTFSATPASVSCDDVGSSITVSCEFTNAGVTTTCDVLVNVEDLAPPVVVVVQNLFVSLAANGEAVIFPETIDQGSFDNCTDQDGLSFNLEPNVFTCSDLGENIVTLTVTDEEGNFNSTWTTVEVFDMLGGTLACNAEIDVDVSSNAVELFVEDILESYSGACTESISLTVQTFSGLIVPGNVITSDYTGEALQAIITDGATGNTCWGTVNVIGNGAGFTICDTECWTTPITDCAGGHTDQDNIEWPCDIELVAFGADPTILSPSNLELIYDVHEMDAQPTIVNYSETGIAMTYSDTVVDVNPEGTLFKIIRTWTVLNWFTGNIYEYVQIIENLEADSPICDTLPRTAPLGDCDSGHSLDDDVEWPADLYVADHRLTVDELITISNLDPLDAEPSFYNNPDDYSSAYLDLFVGLSPSELQLERVWTVTSPAYPGLIWNYGQAIFVDISDFSSLVTVNTFANRPVPGVELNALDVTNETGSATVEGNVSPWKSDNLNNGLSIRDLLIIRKQILGIESMSEIQNMVADVNNNQSVTTLDLAEIRNALIGVSSAVNPNWEFLEEETDQGISTKGHYVAMKPGDVDDSAVLTTTPEYDERANVGFDDILINAGESYEIPIYLTEDMDALGFEVRLSFDATKVDIEDITTNSFDGELSWSNDQGKLTIVSHNTNLDLENFSGSSSDPLMSISVKAKENTVLGWSMFFNENRQSFIVDENYELILLEGEINGEITSGTDDEAFDLEVNVFPNPVTDHLNIEMQDASLNGTIQIFDMSGKLLTHERLQSKIETSNLSEGTYLILIQTNDKAFRKLIQKI